MSSRRGEPTWWQRVLDQRERAFRVAELGPCPHPGCGAPVLWDRSVASPRPEYCHEHRSPAARQARRRARVRRAA